MIDVRTVREVVCAEFGVPIDCTVSETRADPAPKVRRAVAYLCREILLLEHSDIAQALGRYSHVWSVMANKATRDELNQDPEFAEKIGRVKAKLKGML